MDDKKLARLRAKYPEGTKIILHAMSGEPTMRDGLRGTVTYIDDIGQIHMKWENGSRLALIEDDWFDVER